MLSKPIKERGKHIGKGEVESSILSSSTISLPSHTAARKIPHLQEHRRRVGDCTSVPEPPAIAYQQGGAA